MGGFLGFLGSIWSSLGSMGQTALKLGAMIAMDVGAALLGGGTTRGEKLKNKTIASSTYGHPIPRARGTVRLNGQLIFWNKIQETTHKRHSGGFFGLGGSNVYTYSYSTCCAFAFGKKLGGGAAVKFIRIWADGKLLYSTLVSDAALTGTATVVGTVPAGTQAVPISISGGGSLVLSAGDLIHFSTEPNTDYEVQQDVNLGSSATGIVDVYPPLDVDLTGDTISIPGITAPLIDLSSFDPNPHDGSHVTANPVPAGTIRFHYGTATEQPDPAMIAQFGASQAAAYRGLPYVMLAWLQLVNYGNHVPSISAEISFDNASGHYPKTGPIAGVTLTAGSGGGTDQFLLPTPYASTLQFTNPNNILPYMWAVTNQGGSDFLVYKIDTRRNQTLGVATVCPSGFVSPFAIDSDGFIYYVNVGGGGWTLHKFDGQSLDEAASWGVVVGGINSPGLAQTITPWSMQATCFGNAVRVRLVALVVNYNDIHTLSGVWFVDADSLLPFGTFLLGGTPVTLFINPDGSPTSVPGVISSFVSTSTGMPPIPPVVDAKGNLWMMGSSTGLWMFDCQFQSGIYLDPNYIPHEVLYPPSFGNTAVSASVVGSAGAIFYNPGDDSIIVVGSLGLCKVSCSTFQVTASNLATPPWAGLGSAPLSITPDQIGTFLVSAGPGTQWRVDASSLQVLDTYTMSGWFATPVNGLPTYDGNVDSLWWNQGGDLYRVYLDRGEGGGLGLDLIVASIFDEAGYDASEYDVTALSTITTKGYEIDQQPYLDSIKLLQELFLFDMAEIDGTIVCVPRSAGAGVFTITEDDLGATEIGTAPVARVAETLQQETDVPETVWVHYYDETKQLQQATQMDKRISRPYASALVSKPKVTNSRNQLVISTPVTDSPGPMKLQARRILLDHWQARMRSQFKTSIKWIRLDPTDKGNLTYKGETVDVRLTGVDRGAGLALDFQGESYDSGVYAVPASVNQPGGSQSPGLPAPPPPPIGSDNYTLVPVYPLSQTTTTNLALAATVATFDSGLRTQYNARPTLTIADPGAGLTQIYYVTIYDPTFVGEIPGTNTLTVFCNTTAAASHVGEHGYINMGSIVAAGSGATVGNGGPGGQPFPSALIEDDLSGLCDSSNTIFTLSEVPQTLVLLYWNGQLRTDFTVADKILTTAFTRNGVAVAPDTGDKLVAVYFNETL